MPRTVSLLCFFRASAASPAGGRMEVVWEYFGERFGSVLGVISPCLGAAAAAAAAAATV